MYVRLAFAVAAHLDPEILLVDEVLAVGDIKFRQKCLGKMKSVSLGGRTVIYVSHDLASMRNLCSRALWIDYGSIIQDGTPHVVTHQYEEKSFQKNISTTGHFDRNPVPQKDFFIEWVELRDKYGKLCSSYISGDFLEIVFSFYGKAPQDGFTIDWFLYNESGNRISFGSAYPVCNVSFDKTVQKVSCRITSLPLTTGFFRFFFSVWIWGLHRWDEWESNVGFQILHSDPYGTGFDFSGGVNGDFILDQKWRVLD